VAEPLASERQAIRTEAAPTPTGPFSQAIRAGGMVFTSGQAGRNRDTGQLGDARDQTRWALRNIAAILAAAGSSLDRVVKVTLYLKDGVDAAAVNEEYRSAFHEPLPARASVFVSRLKSPDMLVEIEAVATVD
jgi:2-iminobutanoate/2-iminopropanoate deaminase